MQADQDANLLDILQRRIKFVKATDEEVADEAIEKSGVLLEDIGKPITKSIACFIGEESQIR
jgi:hypothetical protein